MCDKFAVLVISCDKYSYVWPAFFHFLNKYWHDCPYKIYLVSNFIKADFTKVENILVGQDLSWSDNVIKALDKIVEENIFIFLEDEFLIDHVDNDKIRNLFNWFLCHDANCLRLNPIPFPDKQFNKNVGIVSKGTIYRVSTVLTLWKKNVLSSLLVQGENAWEFETRGTLRSNQYGQFFSVRKEVIRFRNVIIKGKWLRSGIKMLDRNDIRLNAGSLIPMNVYEEIVFLMKRARTRILYLFPPKFRITMKNILSNSP